LCRSLPSFNCDKDPILAASKATSLLFIESTNSKGNRQWDFATAFFVAPKLLITAGHAALDPLESVKTDRYIFLPGKSSLNADEVSSRGPFAVRCDVVGTMFKSGSSMSKDIAILSSGNFETNHYVPISLDPIPRDSTIDVIGYPGEKRIAWLREKHPELKSLVQGERAGEVLLPTRQLIVTRGVVAHTSAGVTWYNISTCPGLSGSCVVYNGQVHGTVQITQVLIGRRSCRRFLTENNGIAVCSFVSWG
jgi:V8-like Glu-specific endopeptidase